MFVEVKEGGAGGKDSVCPQVAGDLTGKQKHLLWGKPRSRGDGSSCRAGPGGTHNGTKPKKADSQLFIKTA